VTPRLKFIPPYLSCFLNAIKEVFGLIKYRMAREKSEASSTALSMDEIKKEVAKQVWRLTKEDIKKFANYVQEWMLVACHGEPVYTHNLYECSHIGNEHFQSLADDVELHSSSYLPNHISTKSTL